MSLSKNGVHPRLTLTMVVRNCEKTLKPLLVSLRPYVQQIIIGLGGTSTDRTEQIARKYADVIVPCGEFFPDDGYYDFGAARQSLMQYVEGDYWCWVDGDDLIDHPEELPGILDRMDAHGIDRADMVYDYSFDEHGNVMLSHQRERILRTSKNWRWLDCVHETPHSDEPVLTALTDDVKVIHQRREGTGNSGERNLKILLKMAENEPKARTFTALGNAYYSVGKFPEALQWFDRYLNDPEDVFGQWSANCMAARCALRMDDCLRAQTWAMMAAGLLPQYADPYVLLAQAVWYGDRDVEKAEAWVRMAKAAERAPLSQFQLPMDNITQLADVEHRIFATHQQWGDALRVCDDVLKLRPDDLEWRNLSLFYRECVSASQSRAAALHLADHMVKHGDVIRAKGLLDNFLPSTIRTDPAILGGRARLAAILNTAEPETYEAVDLHYKEYDVAVYPRVQWYLERLRASGAKRVLEVGCHIGLISRYLATQGFECVGLDFNQKVVDLANERAQADGLNASFICGRLEDVTEQFDAVLLAEVLEHVAPSVQVQMINKAEQIAPLVLGSVPAEPVGMCEGLFEKGRLGNDTFRPHIFEFDQNDMETLILTDPAREIVNCHKVPWPNDGAYNIPGFGNLVFEFRQRQESAGLGIAFYLGEGWEHWTPSDIEDKGIGGSETAAVRLAEELAARGHYVQVYGPETGVYNGVVYRDHRLWNPDERRDVVVVSRMLAAIKERPNAQVVVLWSHDIGYGDALTDILAANVDKMVVMSAWQKEHWRESYPFLSDEKIVTIGNAIKTYDVGATDRAAHRFIYSSSPDRGLDDLLYRWGAIREMWPDAELHIFYGWQYLDPVSQLRPYKAQLQQMMRQDGVFWHGRTGQKTLAEEFAKAQFWLYPSLLPRERGKEIGPDFHETFCITAIEAQAYGCIPLTRPVGALSERLPDDLAHYADPWETGVILGKLRTFDELPASDQRWLRAEMRENAEAYTWKSVADQWLVMIAGFLLEAALVEVAEGVT